MASFADVQAMESESVRALPADEQAKLLDQRFQEAQHHIAEGRRLLVEWEPVATSCRAGLEALKVARSEQQSSPAPDTGWS